MGDSGLVGDAGRVGDNSCGGDGGGGQISIVLVSDTQPTASFCLFDEVCDFPGDIRSLIFLRRRRARALSREKF